MVVADVLVAEDLLARCKPLCTGLHGDPECSAHGDRLALKGGRLFSGQLVAAGQHDRVLRLELPHAGREGDSQRMRARPVV